MQITHCEVIPCELALDRPARMAGLEAIEHISAVFLKVETRTGQCAWGAATVHPVLTGEDPEEVVRLCRDAAALVPDLHPTNLEYSLSMLAPHLQDSPAAHCAFDLAFHDLLGLAAQMPLYRLLGGFRNRIPSSATVPLGSVREGVERACERASLGFRWLKVKGGVDPDEDVRRVRAIRRAIPEVVLRLDADGGYDLQQALDVSRALEGKLEMLEQPTPPENLDALRQVTALSPVPVLADQSVSGPRSALALAAGRHADGLSVKMAACGGFRGARQVDSIARAAGLTTMVSCLIEPALLTAAGLSFALSSPNVQFGDLDGHLDLRNDPSSATFRLEDGWLVAGETTGLGCSVDL